MNELKIGSYVGNGAAQNISCGFIPDHVRVVNTEDGDAVWEWFKGMPAGTAVKITGAVAPLAANGVSEYAGSSTPGSEASPGFTIGTDLSEADKTHFYIASRSGQGVN